MSEPALKSGHSETAHWTPRPCPTRVEELLDALDLDEALAVERAGQQYEEACRAAARDGASAPHLDACLSDLSDTVATVVRRLYPRQLPVMPGYRLVNEVGRGGMSVVYRGFAEGTGSEFAVKILDGGELARAGRLRLLVEGEVLRRLEHPHIVPILEFGEHDGHTYLVMPLITGGNLRHRLAEWSVTEEDCPADEVADRKLTIATLVEKLARAVAHVHQRGVIHRDIKPANVLLDAEGEPLLCDFGLARRIDETLLITRANEFAGTIPYMAPEQLDGRPDLTTAVDVYSLGAILYELLTGHPPFAEPGTQLAQLMKRKAEENQPPHPSTSNPRLPGDGDLEWIAMECLYRDPTDGFENALALADALERYRTGRRVRERETWRQLGRRLLRPVSGELREPEYVLRWHQAMRIEGVTCILAHVGMFLLLANHSAGWVLWLWLLTTDTLLGWFIWLRVRWTNGTRLTPMESDVRHLWIGATAGEVLLFMIHCPLFAAADPEAVARFYPTWAVMRGVLFFIEGHLFWARLRLVSVAYAAAAVAMPWLGVHSALLYGFLTGGWFIWFSLQGKRRAAVPGVEPAH